MLIIENLGGIDKEEAIRNAIENGYTITFYYMGKDYEERKKRGEKPKANYRRVEPFALGKTKEGNSILRGFQYAGATNSKNGVYKTFRLDQIKGNVINVYDSQGKTIRSFEPRTYKEKRVYKDGSVRYVDASYREDGTDKKMKGGVNKYFDVDRENLVDIPTKQVQQKEPEPTVNEPVKPKINQPAPKQIVKPLQQKEPEPNLPDDKMGDLERLNKITQDQNEYTADDEIELAENVSSGFLKWLYKLYESR